MHVCVSVIVGGGGGGGREEESERAHVHTRKQGKYSDLAATC